MRVKTTPAPFEAAILLAVALIAVLLLSTPGKAGSGDLQAPAPASQPISAPV